ncbi:hypothetical protein [Aromatoleum evansii]|uniref:Uncharacterized protein n=1 Tax=Aromatoleum evansii TaxID=59406 RepID=A0ABZ1AMM6_AROEV|nr:hypothetical protein [Aromatoleum evansii]NMG30514.1 hypothetical protein [Aromatoleum evansii]WRL47110.1 hypothetical protein U5817_03390 [Aromatoleum evansii]
MKTFPRKLAAAIIVLGFATTASYAATVSATAPAQGSQASAPAAPVTMLARKGADDGAPKPRPDDTGCDDNGTDICNAIVAKKGADDGGGRKPRPDDTGCDDNGTDICHAVVAKKGADDTHPEDESEFETETVG